MYARSVDVYVADLKSVACEEDLLSVAELGEALSIATSRSLNGYLALRTWLRRLLAEYLDCPASEIRFGLDEAGRSGVVSPQTDLTFSLSFSGTTALLAVAFRRDIGVAIETTIDRHPEPNALAADLTDVERDRCSRALRPARVYLQFLVRKQALVHATGASAGTDLSRLDASGLSPVAIDDYLISDLHLGDDVVASVAVPEGSVVTLTIDDAGLELEPQLAAAV